METKVIENKTVSEIIKAIKELIIDRHGIPTRILTDKGLEFNNDQTCKLANNYNFHWDFASPRHHETVWAVERANQTLMEILKRLSNFDSTNWKDYLQQATHAYNISFHRALNTSLFILKFGKEPRILDM